MIIKIKYKLIDDNKIYEYKLKPSDYFDLKKNANYKIDDIPKFLMLENYLDYDISKISFIYLSIIDKQNYLSIESNYWNNGKSTSIKYKEFNYDKNYIYEFLKIFKNFMKNEEELTEILCFYRNEINILELRTHIITNDIGLKINEFKKTNIGKFEVLGKFNIE